MSTETYCPIIMNWHTRLTQVKAEMDFSFKEIAELTGTSSTQVRRWRDGEASPTGPQKAIIEGLHDWLVEDTFGGKSYLLEVARRDGHYEFLQTLLCERS